MREEEHLAAFLAEAPAALSPEVATWAVRAVWESLPLARRRADRDRLLRRAAMLLPGLPWRKAQRLAAMLRAARREGPAEPATLDTPEGCVAAALLAYPGREGALSLAQVYRILARRIRVSDLEMQVGAVRQSASNNDGQSPEEIMSQFRFEAGEDARDKWIRQGTTSILERAGHMQLMEAASKIPRYAAQFQGFTGLADEWRGASLLDLARECLERSGVRTKGLNREDVVKLALEHRSGNNTTSDFAILLENAVSKTLLGRYAVTPVTYRRFCGIRAVKNFRAASFYRAGSFGTLDSVAEGGEIKQKQIPDGEKTTITAASKANIIGLSRQAIVNDDLEVFTELAGALGEAAAYTVEADVYALLLQNGGLGPTQDDGLPVFDASRGNIGATGTMSADSWGSAAAALASQQDPSKNVFLEMEPAVWLGPQALKIAAKKLNTSAADPSAPNSGVGNGVQGMVRDVIGSARLTGTRHYLFADPANYPMFAVGFLDGREEPKIDQAEGWRSDGVEWRCRLYYGVAVLDTRTGVTCAGQ